MCCFVMAISYVGSWPISLNGNLNDQQLLMKMMKRFKSIALCWSMGDDMELGDNQLVTR